MGKLKFYINDKSKLNEYEKKYKKISYRKLIEYLFTDVILCNDITKLFYSNINGEYIEPEIEIGTDYNSDEDYYYDIYQYFIVDFPNFNLDFMKKYCQNEIILYYIEKLDLYILGVDQFATSCDYV